LGSKENFKERNKDMNQLKLAKTLGAVLLTLCAASSVQAVPLSDLLDDGSLTAADKLFDQWVVTFNGASDPEFNFDYSLIDVTALNDGGFDPGPGINIDFGSQMGVSGDGIYAYKDLTIGFHVSTFGDELIKDNSLDLGSPISFLTTSNEDGFVDTGAAVEEWVTDASGAQLAHKFIEFSNLDGQLTSNFPDHAEFLPQDEIFVKKNFLVWATDPLETATLGGVEQRFSQVPEPGTLAMFGLGLMGFAFRVKGRKNQQG
jgi:hypothetical protein